MNLDRLASERSQLIRIYAVVKKKMLRQGSAMQDLNFQSQAEHYNVVVSKRLAYHLLRQIRLRLKTN